MRFDNTTDRPPGELPPPAEIVDTAQHARYMMMRLHRKLAD